MKVPFVDLYALHKAHEEEFKELFERVLRTSAFILGPEIKQFEEAFAAYLGSSECVAVNSGTSALHLALLALGIGAGDEVITVPNTFIATAEAISAVGARPVFVDVDPHSYCMDPKLVEAAITPRTRALLPVHLYGQCADLDPLLELCKRYNLFLIEDACQAHGATYKGKRAGSIGTIGCFSFYPGKNLGAFGEGGACVTDDPQLAAKIRMLRDHGSVKKYEHVMPGFNFRLEALQGGILRLKLPRLDGENERRHTAAALYRRLFNGSAVKAPREMPYGTHVYHLFIVQVENRAELMKHLAAAGIDTGLHYPLPLHLQHAYQELGYKRGSFPVTEQLAERILSLPMQPNLSDEAIEYVCETIVAFLAPKALPAKAS